ncbi:Hemoglobinase-type cysteine proteinase, partial [Trichostrongylus colubriformis]
LTAKKLDETLRDMHRNHKFAQLVFYLEADQGGSMFEGILKNNINVYAVTAAAGGESTDATYCDLHETMQLPCLGDEFSVNWMEDSDMVDTTIETLKEQFETVQELTEGSRVCHFGNLSMVREPVSWFQGVGNTILRTSKANGLTTTKGTVKNRHRRVSWPSRDVELMHLQKLKQLGYRSATVDAEISRIHEDRRNVENVFTELINSLVSDAAERRSLLEEKSSIKNLDCHDDVVQMFILICVNVNKYDHALKYMYVLNNFCNKFDDSGKIIGAMRMICPGTRNRFI